MLEFLSLTFSSLTWEEPVGYSGSHLGGFPSTPTAGGGLGAIALVSVRHSMATAVAAVLSAAWGGRTIQELLSLWSRGP